MVDSSGHDASMHTFSSNALISAKNVRVAERLANLYAYLLENHCIDCLVGFDPNILTIFSRDVLKRIWNNDPVWETMVPQQVAHAIKRRGAVLGTQTSLPRRRSRTDAKVLKKQRHDDTRTGLRSSHRAILRGYRVSVAVALAVAGCARESGCDFRLRGCQSKLSRPPAVAIRALQCPG